MNKPVIMTDIRRKGLLFVISSPSGTGKTTLARRLMAAHPEIDMSISATTRPPRPAETPGKDYLFVSDAEFDTMIARGQMLEYATVFGNRYGTPSAPVIEAIRAGRDVLFDVDWQGAQLLKASELSGSLVTIFILPPSIAEVERRLRGRAQDSDTVIEHRMAKVKDHISHWAEYDYVLINDDLDLCYSRIETIVEAERQRFPRQTCLRNHVAGLYAELENRQE